MPNILRPKAAWKKLGVGRTTFYEEYVAKGRIRLVHLGERARGVVDDEIDTLIEEMRAERDAPLTHQK
jgi:predicted DNA-binding transcriptional regulator AlpA